jgi:lysophospholipase L1-like esterase
MGRRPRLSAHAVVAALATTLLVLVPGVPAVADTKPTAAVALGDSFIGGEAAGSYEPGSNRPGNYCQRSTVSEIHRTAIPGIQRTINLACSGATIANVLLGGESRYGEAPQAEQLRAVASRYDVRLVVLNVGANDIGFTDAVIDCITAFVGGADCEPKWTPLIAARSAAARPRIGQALRDIFTVMREAGYADDDWLLALQGYSSPVPARMRPLSWYGQIVAGCPVEPAAMVWAHDQMIEEFSAMTRGAAADVGVRYLELKGAFDGHEICAAGATAQTEWVRGTFIDLSQLPYGIGFNVVQQSMHPHHLGHAQLGRCLTEFVALAGREVRCVAGDDGNLHAVPL